MSAWYNMTHLYAWLIYMWDITHLNVWHESLTNVTRIARHRKVCLIQYDSFIYMIHLCMGHDSCIREIWVINNVYTWDMSHSQCDTNHSAHKRLLDTIWLIYIHDSFTYGTWLIYMWDMSHSRMWHKSFDTETSMGWLRWVDALKL